MSFLKHFDMNGVTFQALLTPQMPQFQSIFGGILTLLVYGSSLAYLMFNIIQWQTGQNLPKITSTQSVINEYTLNSPESILELQSIPYGEGGNNIDPFDPQNLIFQVQTQQIVNGIPVTQLENAEYDVHKSFDLYTVQLKNMTLKIDQNRMVQISGQSYGVILSLCQEGTVSSRFKCASEKIIKKYFKQSGNKIQVTTKIRQFNTNTKQLEFIQKQYLFVIDNTYTIYGQIMYSLARTIVDDGLLFPDETTFDYINNIEVISQQINYDKMNEYFQNPVFFQISLRLFPIQSIHNVQYQKLNEILADSGSIISIIMYFQFIAIFFNQKTMETFAINKVIEIYYPQFSNIIVTKSLFGKIKRIQYKSKDIEISKFMAYYKQLKHIAEYKLSIINQLHEISRLYLLFRMMNKEDLIQKVNSISIPMKILSEGNPINNDYTSNLNKSNLDTIGQQFLESNEICLDDRDFSSVSQLQANNLVEFDQVEVQNI